MRPFQEFIYKQWKEVPAEAIEDSDDEIFVDLRKSRYGVPVIRLKSLERTNQERFKQIQPVDDEHLNVLNLFIDTISKERFYRRFRYTAQFLHDLKHDPENEIEMYEFHKFHTVGGTTQFTM